MRNIFQAKAERIAADIEMLATYNSFHENPGISRQLFTDAEIQARNYIKDGMRRIDMKVHEDAIGNIYGILEGTDPALAPVWSGSHIDTVLSGGKYDGIVGVVGALEACRVIRENKIPHERSIVALVFSSEECGRFGMGCIGSRAMAGHLPLEKTKELYDNDGTSLYQELERLGYTKMDYDETVLKHCGDVFASVELHIEQATMLEETGNPVGIVQAICAPTYICVTITGQQKHAGSTPMDVRKDALCAAAQVILEVEKLARSYENKHTVATVGKIRILPNSSNVIPGEVDFMVDIRDIDEALKTELTQKIQAALKDVISTRNLDYTFHIATDDIPCSCDEDIIRIITQSCQARGLPEFRMMSGAYHDSLLISEFAPIGMIFVPSKDGISHNPSEYTSIEEITCGVNVLTDTLLELSNRKTLS